MRKIAFIIAVIGLAILIGLLLSNPKPVTTLEGLLPGTGVTISGTVEEARKFGTGTLLTINDVPIFCECLGSYVGKQVKITGMVERFPKDLRIKAFSIKVVS